ncbi:MAG: hypothetical protein K0V04_25140 [Deltaproteobacteria bacterium]|nr:hypothetical protein [Deltaproteobacteria bacterium]
MFSTKRVLLPVVVLLSMVAPLGCAEELGARDPDSNDRQLAVCNEQYEAEGDHHSGAQVDPDGWTAMKGHGLDDRNSFMDHTGGEGASLEWSNMKHPPAQYKLTIRYANGSVQDFNDRPVIIRINDDDRQEIPMEFPVVERDNWSTWRTVATDEFTAEEGIHRLTIEVAKNWGGPNIDWIYLEVMNKDEVLGCGGG